MSTIQERNGLQDDKIIAGDFLIIPEKTDQQQTMSSSQSNQGEHQALDLNTLFQKDAPLNTIKEMIGYVLRNPSDQGASITFRPGDSETLRAIGKHIGVIPMAEEAMPFEFANKSSVDITHALLVSLQSYLGDAGIQLPLHWDPSIGKTKTL